MTMSPKIIIADDYLCERCASIRVPKNQNVERRYCNACFAEWDRRYQKALDEWRAANSARRAERQLREPKPHLCEACAHVRPYHYCTECEAE
jgi:hypothetical protein